MQPVASPVILEASTPPIADRNRIEEMDVALAQVPERLTLPTREPPDEHPAPAPSASPIAPAANGELSEAQVNAIKSAILAKEQFLGELIEHAFRWELNGGEVRLFFPTESRALAEMLQGRDPMERLRNITSRILGQTVRVCVKLEAVPGAGATTRISGTRELRAKFEQDPIVRAMMERFGGQISDVKRRGEE
jgi:hypothetical protein